ncbi:MAG TPA: serine/threonine-protein kinase [Gemmataceae bacterium]|jgi:serine/threonine-protein kinase|nr:serine/threonine-protein kinase [Gemmataceae bacterium]
MIGEHLGKWIIERELGRGGMGSVYLGREETSGQLAALKVLTPELSQEPGFLERFRREISAVSALDHPNIVKFYEAGEDERRHYYAMEYVEGEDFEVILARSGRLAWKEVLDIALQICPALKHAHDRGIIHRDLKPHNLLRSDSGQVKLTDFGIAKVFASRQLTRAGGIVGTADYLSPEQAMGKPATKRSDLYSLGVVLYRMLTGWTPFQGNSTAELLHKHVYARFDRPAKRVLDVPAEFDDIVCRLLEKDPDKRPPDALVLQRELEFLRKKNERRAMPTQVYPSDHKTTVENGEEEAPAEGPGPATLMSRLMREELERQKKGGALSQFFNRPKILATFFLLVVGLIVWAFWPHTPADPQALFNRGQALMLSDDPAKWEEGWNNYLSLLVRDFPDFPQRAEAESLHRQMDARRALHRALAKKKAEPTSEAQRFYQKGLRQFEAGDLEDARQTWQNVATAFAPVSADKPWIALAKEGLKASSPDAPGAAERRQALEKTLQEIADANKLENRQTVLDSFKALATLYQGDPGALELIRQAESRVK